mmetsp:Transcript_13817/g.28868  ORF Transcript_13817/g.28868 Transcript_13817/m.28868 type:complete len:86 (-) Transcript_13817:346-603(-)
MRVAPAVPPSLRSNPSAAQRATDMRMGAAPVHSAVQEAPRDSRKVHLCAVFVHRVEARKRSGGVPSVDGLEADHADVLELILARC